MHMRNVAIVRSVTAAAAAAAAAVMPCGMTRRRCVTHERTHTTLRALHAPLYTSRRAYHSDKDTAATVRGGDDGGSDDNNNSNNGGDDDGVDLGTLPSLRTTLPPDEASLPEGDFLKCLRKEMMDEQLRLDKEEAPPRVPSGWQMYHVDGTSLIYGRRVWLPPAPAATGGPEVWLKDSNSNSDNTQASQQPPRPRHMERHYVRIQLTCRDASLDPECDIRGEHFPFSLFVQRVASDDEAEAAAATAEAAAIAAAHERLQKQRPREHEGGDDDVDEAVQRHAAQGNDSQQQQQQQCADATTTTTPSSSSSSPPDSDSDTAVVRQLRATFCEGDIIHADEDDTSDTLSIFRNSLEVRCDVVDGELVVNNIVLHGEYSSGDGASVDEGNGTTQQQQPSTGQSLRAVYDDVFAGYSGPALSETDDELLDSFYAWLAERGIDDHFGEFVGQYSVWVEQAEYERWLQQLHDFVAA